MGFKNHYIIGHWHHKSRPKQPNAIPIFDILHS